MPILFADFVARRLFSPAKRHSSRLVSKQNRSKFIRNGDYEQALRTGVQRVLQNFSDVELVSLANCFLTLGLTIFHQEILQNIIYLINDPRQRFLVLQAAHAKKLVSKDLALTVCGSLIRADAVSDDITEPLLQMIREFELVQDLSKYFYRVTSPHFLLEILKMVAKKGECSFSDFGCDWTIRDYHKISCLVEKEILPNIADPDVMHDISRMSERIPEDHLDYPRALTAALRKHLDLNLRYLTNKVRSGNFFVGLFFARKRLFLGFDKSEMNVYRYQECMSGFDSTKGNGDHKFRILAGGVF